MEVVLGINALFGLIVYLDERELNRDFWVALAGLTVTIWTVYLIGFNGGMFPR